MIVGHLNVRSILTNFDLLRDFVGHNDLDIFGVSETWLNVNIPTTSVEIYQYNFIRVDRDGRGGGIGLYIRTNIQYQIVIQKADPHLEQLWVKSLINGKKYVIGVLYRPPTANILHFFDELDKAMSETLPFGENIIIMGDFNINLLNYNNSVSFLNDFLEAHDLKQLVNEPTRVTNSSQSLLDLLMVSKTECVEYVNVINANVSDHHATIFKGKPFISKPTEKFVTYRDYKNFNESEFFKDFHMVNWNHIYSLENVDDMVKYLSENLLRTFNIHAPLKIVRCTKPAAPWLTFCIRKMMDLRDRAYNSFKKHRTQQKWDYYKTLRNYTRQAIQREKRPIWIFTFPKKIIKIHGKLCVISILLIR